MIFKKNDKNYVEIFLQRILSLSYRISLHSAPMKPFIRFSKEIEYIYENDRLMDRSLFWNFDDKLQKILLKIIKSIASPKQLSHSCVERWKINMEKKFENSKRNLKILINEKKPFQIQYMPRDKFIFNRVEAGTRFLYVGCGAGTECLRLANHGYKVIGIDTDFKLTTVANAWSQYLALPFKAICMDIMSLGFSEGMFDSFLLEFYGHQPLLYQSLLIQKNLSHILKKGGKGFFVACRKRYTPFMILMSGRYPASMIKWLSPQISLDYPNSQPEGSEEHLAFGLYWRSHNLNSLSSELKKFFDVVECLYERDPRYVICVVEPKKKLDTNAFLEPYLDWEDSSYQHTKFSVSSIERILTQIESICDLLELHEKNVIHFFENKSAGKTSPFQSIHGDSSEIIRLLESTFSAANQPYWLD